MTAAPLIDPARWPFEMPLRVPLALRPPLPYPDEHCLFWVCGDCTARGFTRQHLDEWAGVCPNGHRSEAEPHTCRCQHHAAEHSNVVNGACLADGCRCEKLTEMYGCGYYREAS
jgi:hypothetical protein